MNCYKCNKTFADSAHLKRHQTGKRGCLQEKPKEDPVCSMCDKKFSTASNLKAHMRNYHSVNDSQTVIARDHNTINQDNSTKITVNLTINNPKNFISPDVDFLEEMPPVKLRELLGDPPRPTMIARLFSEIYLADDKPSNHSVLLESVTSENGYCYNEKWRKQATEALITQCASNAALKLTDIEHVYENVMSKSNAVAVTEMCETIEREDFTGELYKVLREKISEALIEFTHNKEMLLQKAKQEALGPIKYPKSHAFDGWKEGGALREAAIAANRS